MLRLPHLREKLADATSPGLLEIFEHYDLAVSRRDSFRVDPGKTDLTEEYDRVCHDLEQEIMRYLR
jgi:hypothetical protein